MPLSPRGHALFRPVVALAIFCAVALVLGLSGPAGTQPGAALAHDHGDPTQELRDMQSWVDAWFSEHPMVGAEGMNAQGVYAAEFVALGTAFNADADATTQVDTVKINVGETVQWRRIIGSHTVTNGTGAADPNAGTDFDVILDAASPIYQYTFNSTGTFPFFCRPHEGFNMKGAVIVIDPTPTRSTTWGELKVLHHQPMP